MLKKFLGKRVNGLESPDHLKPVAYAVYSLSKKILFNNDIQDVLRRDAKQNNLKEIYLFQEVAHDYSVYYTLELVYDGDGLISDISRRDMNSPDVYVKDTRYISLTINLSKYLVKIIEDCLNKQVIRLKYDFVINPNFDPIILTITEIKVVNPKLAALNKGLNAEQLENLTLFKNEYKTSDFIRRDSVIKEPEIESTTTTTIKKATNTNIFLSFVSKFLSGDTKKTNSVKTIKPVFSLSNNISPGPAKDLNNTLISQSKTQTSLGNRLKSTKASFKFSSKTDKGRSFKRSAMFPNLKPSASLDLFLKQEEERILENKSKKSPLLDYAEQLPSIKKIKKSKKKKIKKNKLKLIYKQKI